MDNENLSKLMELVTINDMELDICDEFLKTLMAILRLPLDTKKKCIMCKISEYDSGKVKNPIIMTKTDYMRFRLADKLGKMVLKYWPDKNQYDKELDLITRKIMLESTEFTIPSKEWDDLTSDAEIIFIV